jgi:acyl-CoA thioester hydrolase
MVKKINNEIEIKSENKIRIRYDEVDKMGYVYHGNYAKYYHISRTELLRKIGISDKELESQDIILPVFEMNIKYLKPVFYDDVILVITTISNLRNSSLAFAHEVRDQKGELINRAVSKVAFVGINTRKPMRVPQFIVDRIRHYTGSEKLN